MTIKKKAILFLLIFSVLLLVGFGVYSYFYSNGDFYGGVDVSIRYFDPEVDDEFIYNANSINLKCYYGSLPGEFSDDYFDSVTEISYIETVHCFTEVEIKNNGVTDISLQVSDPSAFEYSMSGVYVDFSNISFSWNSKILSPGETTNLRATFDAVVTPDFFSNEEISVYDKIGSSDNIGSVDLNASFKLKATEVHN